MQIFLWVSSRHIIDLSLCALYHTYWLVLNRILSFFFCYKADRRWKIQDVQNRSSQHLLGWIKYKTCRVTTWYLGDHINVALYGRALSRHEVSQKVTFLLIYLLFFRNSTRNHVTGNCVSVTTSLFQALVTYKQRQRIILVIFYLSTSEYQW